MFYMKLYYFIYLVYKIFINEKCIVFEIYKKYYFTYMY